MADIEHKNITDPEVHEPKGASAAPEGYIYVADGLGSGAWISPEPKGADTATANEIYVADGLGSGAFKQTSASCYGQMIITNNTVAQPIAVASTNLDLDTNYTKITFGWTSPYTENMTFATDKVTVSVSGLYEMGFWASLRVPKNANFLGIKYAINDTAPYSLQKIVTQSNTAADRKNISGESLVQLAAGQSLSLYVGALTTDSPVFEEAGMVLKLLKEA